MSNDKKMKFGTKAIHAGVQPDPTTGAIMTPIYQTSTYVQEAPGVNKGFGYARGKNPTREALQDALAALENGKHCVAHVLISFYHFNLHFSVQSLLFFAV